METATVVLLREWERIGEKLSPGALLTLSAIEAENLVAAKVADYVAERESRVLETPRVAAMIYKPATVARFRG